LFDSLHSLDIAVRIHRRPNELPFATPFDQDEEHATYDRGQAHLLWRGFATAHRLLEEFRAPFIGKASPISFFWGSFDLAVSLYSGRPAPLHPGGAPNCPDWVQQEAYSREEVAAGYWPGTSEIGPMFYAYAYPAPSGYETAAIEPAAASFDRSLGEFVLSWDAARAAPQPDATVQSFLASTFAAATRHAEWDLGLLQPAHYPNRRPPRRAWTVVDRSR
ncbi:MAG TPA: DUF5996 family protein, partial [Candidatus Limnocylindria bacterium]|nr:DUF5996 family protein [Candidatus Limnocylindria bacterium]